MQMGPRALIQFPPEKEFPRKEILLKIWAQHETTSDSNFISFDDNIEKKRYCSTIKRLKITNKIYFIVLELDYETDERIFREILHNISDDLINNFNEPHFNHILSETYRTIKNYSDLDEEQQFLRLFEDKTKIDIFTILRQGIISKSQLQTTLESTFGYGNLNIDLFLTPFIRLGLLQIEKVPGTDDSIFLLEDVFCSYIPPKINPKNDILVNKILNEIKTPKILKETDFPRILKLYQEAGVKALFALLNEDIIEGMHYEIALTILKNNQQLLDDLEKEDFIFVQEDKIYLNFELGFHKFTPTYLFPILAQRYNNGEISLDQLVKQIDFLKIDELDMNLGPNWNRIRPIQN